MEHVILDLGVASLSPSLGVETSNKLFFKKANGGPPAICLKKKSLRDTQPSRRITIGLEASEPSVRKVIEALRSSTPKSTLPKKLEAAQVCSLKTEKTYLVVTGLSSKPSRRTKVIFKVTLHIKIELLDNEGKGERKKEGNFTILGS